MAVPLHGSEWEHAEEIEAQHPKRDEEGLGEARRDLAYGWGCGLPASNGDDGQDAKAVDRDIAQPSSSARDEHLMHLVEEGAQGRKSNGEGWPLG